MKIAGIAEDWPWFERGTRLRQLSTGRTGVHTGEVKTSAPPMFVVEWDDAPGNFGNLSARECEPVDLCDPEPDYCLCCGQATCYLADIGIDCEGS